MITEPDYENLRTYQHDRTVQVWSLVVSVALNVLLWILLTWHALMNLSGVQQQKPEQIVEFNSSSIQIRPPVPQAVPQQHKAPPPTAPKPQPQKAQQKAVVPRPQAQPTELARITPHAPPQPPRSQPQNRQAALAEQLAQQEVAFAREAQQLNNSHSPTDVATADPHLHDQINNDFRASFAGTRILAGKGDGFLVPLQRWHGTGISAGQNCYYGRYYWTYPTGGQEIGNIPWPFCYPPSEDPIAHGVREFPFPLPNDPAYRLPSGTPIQPIAKEVYNDWLSSH